MPMVATSNVGSGTTIASSCTGGAPSLRPVTTVTSWPSSVSTGLTVHAR